MKTKLLFTFLLAIVIQFTNAQMVVTQSGDIVTFTFDDNTPSDLFDANGSPINLYTWINMGDTSAGSAQSFPTGGWPGTAMTDNGGNIYSISIDLSALYPIGTMVNQINFILNGAGSPQTSDLLATDFGFSPLTLDIADLNKQNNEIKFVNGKLFGSNNVVYNINAYNVMGQVVKSYSNQNLSQNVGLDLVSKKSNLYYSNRIFSRH